MTNRELEMSKKAITSTMIGSLSVIEEVFGPHWEDQSDDRQKLLKSLYQLARQKILFLGNREIKRLVRKVENER